MHSTKTLPISGRAPTPSPFTFLDVDEARYPGFAEDGIVLGEQAVEGESAQALARESLDLQRRL